MTHFNTKDMEKKRKSTIQLRIKNYELKIKEKYNRNGATDAKESSDG